MEAWFTETVQSHFVGLILKISIFIRISFTTRSLFREGRWKLVVNEHVPRDNEDEEKYERRCPKGKINQKRLISCRGISESTVTLRGWCVENIIIHFNLKIIKSIVWNSGITYKPELLTTFLASKWRIVRVALFPNRNCIVKGIRSYSNAKAVMNNLLMSLSAYIHSVNTCVHAWFCLSIAKELTYKNLQMKMNTCISCTCEVFTWWRLRLLCVDEKTHMEWTCITTNNGV